jgi:hypothetical protein
MVRLKEQLSSSIGGDGMVWRPAGKIISCSEKVVYSDIYPIRFVMPDLIRHPVLSWIPTSAGMTACAKTSYARFIKTFFSIPRYDLFPQFFWRHLSRITFSSPLKSINPFVVSLLFIEWPLKERISLC